MLTGGASAVSGRANGARDVRSRPGLQHFSLPTSDASLLVHSETMQQYHLSRSSTDPTPRRGNSATGPTSRTEDPALAVRANTVRNLRSESENLFRRELMLFSLTSIPIFVASLVLVVLDSAEYAGE